MRVNFRQGIVGHQSGGFLNINPSGNVEILTDNRPVILTVAHVNTNYTYSENNNVEPAWFGPFLASENYWLYWDFNLLTFERTFGYTTLEPIAQSVEPTVGTDSFSEPYLQVGRHWYDTANFRHYVWRGSFWSEVLRVFAAQLTNGNTFIPQTITGGSFIGTQIGNTSSVRSGRVLFDEASDPIRRDNGTFFTTEDQFFASAARVDAIRLESNVARAQFPNNTAAFTPVAWYDEGKARSAEYDDIGTTVIGMLTEDVTPNGVGGVVIQGVVTNEQWDWFNGSPASVSVGAQLWIENGSLVPYDPHVQNTILYPKGRVPVARVLDRNTIVFEQGLGGKGERGPVGSIENIPPATTIELGGGRLSVPATNTSSPIIVGNNDPRLTDARPPLPHTHDGDDVGFTPSAGITANNVEGALVELGNGKLNKSGGTMSGFLTLHSTPTSNFHAATKQYVDGLVNGLVWLDPICTLNLVSDQETVPPGTPIIGDSYIIPPGATGAWSSIPAGHVTVWDGTIWVDRGAVTSMSSGSNDVRFGVAFTTTTLLSGSLVGNKNKIALYSGTTGAFLGFESGVPSSNNAVFVCGSSDIFAFDQFAYSSSSSKWVQFGGADSVTGDGTTTVTTGNVLSVKQYGDGGEVDAKFWQGLEPNDVAPVGDGTTTVVTGSTVSVKQFDDGGEVDAKFWQNLEPSDLISQFTSGTHTIPGSAISLAPFTSSITGLGGFVSANVQAYAEEVFDKKASLTPTYADVLSLPPAVTNPGMLAHVQSEDTIYFANDGNWEALARDPHSHTFPYDMAFFIAGFMVADAVAGSFLITRDVSIPSSATDSLAVTEIPPTSPVTLDLNVNGSTVGTIDFATGAFAGTFSVPFDVNLTSGDKFQVVMPSVADPTMKDITITVVGCALAETCSAGGVGS